MNWYKKAINKAINFNPEEINQIVQSFKNGKRISDISNDILVSPLIIYRTLKQFLGEDEYNKIKQERFQMN